MSHMLIQGDARRLPLADGSVHCCVTSPPYWGLRSYGHWWMQRVWGSIGDFSPPRRHRGRWWQRLAWRAAERGGIFSPNGRSWIGAFGLEPTPDLFVRNMVAVFREVRRVLRPDGTCWLNIGDSYAGSWGAQGRGGAPSESSTLRGNGHVGGGPKIKSMSAVQIAAHPHRESCTGSIRSSGKYRLRSDLTPDQVAYVLAELAKARSISADTQNGRS